MTRKRILFVDDDALILAGLRGVLYADRKRWEMTFVNGGEAALATLQTQQFDAVVSDMRMPDLDGAALLECVRAKHPATRRLILSGSAETADAVRAAASAEEVLSKPCNAKTLREVLERVLA